MITIGNGEKCPYCDEILNENQFEHLKEKHPKEMEEKLFPKESKKETMTFTEAVKDRFFFDKDNDTWIDKYAAEFGNDPRINVAGIIEEICEMGETAIKGCNKYHKEQIDAIQKKIGKDVSEL